MSHAIINIDEINPAVKLIANPEKVKVLEKYIARPCTLSISEQDMDIYNTARTIPEWEVYFIEIMISLCPFRAPQVIKLPKVMHLGSTFVKPTVERRLFTTENYSMVVEFYVENPNKNQHFSRLNRVKKSRQ